MNEINDKASLILQIFRDVLKNDKISFEDDFFAVGGDSKMAMQIMAKIRESHLNISLSKFLSCRSVKDVVEAVNGEMIDYTSLIDSLIDCMETKEIVDNKPSTTVPCISGKKTYKSVLLTGATGYLGSHIALQLLQQTESEIYLLVRGESIDICRERIRSVWSRYHGEDILEKYDKRLYVIQGDVSKNKLGLKAIEYNDMAKKIDVIIHSAAVVSHIETWEKYKSANIEGTENILKFAMYVKKKDVNYISTIATEITPERLCTMEAFTEESILEEDSPILYVKSKIACEKLLDTYRKRGCNIKIFRMGFLIQDYNTGIFQKNMEENGFFKIITLLKKMKVFPNIKEKMIDLTYVNQAADAVVKLSLQEDNINTYHIYNTSKVSISDIGVEFKKINPEIQVLEMDEYREYLYSNYSKYKEELEQLSLILMTDSEININVFGLSRNYLTMELLSSSNFEWSTWDNKTVNDMYRIAEV